MLDTELTKESDRLGTEAILPLLIKLSVPGIVGMVIQSLYNVVDSIYIGHLSKEALAAISLAFPVQMILIAIGAGTGVGASSLISRSLGQNRTEQANSVAEHTMLITVIYGVVVAILGFFFSDNLIRLFTNEQHLINLAVDYTRIILVSSIAIFFPVIANNILRGEGNTFVPMLTMIIGAGLNILFDPFLIFGIGIFPKLGIAGAAIATVTSRLIGGIFILWILFKGDNQIEIKFKNFEFNFGLVKKIYKVGIPAMAMPMSTSLMVAGANRIVGTYSALAVAVFGVYFRLLSFVFLTVVGLAQGYMPIVGYNYGHCRQDRMRETVKLGLIVSTIITTAGFATFQLFPKVLLQLFNDNPQLLEMGVTALKRMSLGFVVMGPALIASTTFQAIGKGFPSLVHSISKQILIVLPVMYFLGEVYGLEMLWFAVPISELLTAVGIISWMVITLRQVYTNLEEVEINQD
ncbi:MAG: MATE family efflux transporter [Bacillota bacterium]